MNNLLIPALLGTIFFLLHGAASANDLVKFPTGPAAWTVTVTASQISPSAAPPSAGQVRVVSMAVAQDAEKRHTVVTWSNNWAEERWEIYQYNLLLSEDLVGHAFATGNGGPRSIPFVEYSFSWLRPSFLQEKDPIAYQGYQCFHYLGKVPRATLNGGNDEVHGSTQAEAWIDSKTLLPVALDDGTGLGTFAFQKDPPPPLTLPAKYQNVYIRYKQGKGIFDTAPPPTH